MNPMDRSGADAKEGPGGAEVDEPGGETARDITDSARVMPAASRSRRKPGWIAVAAVVGVLVLSIAAGLSAGSLYAEHRRSVAATEALQAAQRYVSLLTNINADKLVGKSDEILNGSTGEFHEKFSKANGKLGTLLANNNVVARGEIVEAAVKGVTPTRVVVLMFIDQSVSTRKNPELTIERSRIRMVMTKVSGQWLASRVNLI